MIVLPRQLNLLEIAAVTQSRIRPILKASRSLISVCLVMRSSPEEFSNSPSSKRMKGARLLAAGLKTISAAFIVLYRWDVSKPPGRPQSGQAALLKHLMVPVGVERVQIQLLQEGRQARPCPVRSSVRRAGSSGFLGAGGEDHGGGESVDAQSWDVDLVTAVRRKLQRDKQTEIKTQLHLILTIVYPTLTASLCHRL